MISTEALIAKFEYALEQDWGYIWGTAGELWTEADQERIEKTTDSDRAQARKFGSKWIGHRVTDCSGLFYWAFKTLGGTMYHGSNTMYLKWCVYKGELKKGKRTDHATLKPGTAVFVWNGKTYSHVGLYIGDGWVIEAASTIQGVIKTKVTDSKWTHWGELKGVAYDGMSTEPVPDKPTIKKGAKGPSVKECQEMLLELGYDLGKYGADGDFGAMTEKAVKAFQKDHDGPDSRALEVDGIVGPATWWALEQAVKGQKPGCTVTITGLSKETAEEIVAKYGGTITAG